MPYLAVPFWFGTVVTWSLQTERDWVLEGRGDSHMSLTFPWHQVQCHAQSMSGEEKARKWEWEGNANLTPH